MAGNDRKGTFSKDLKAFIIMTVAAVLFAVNMRAFVRAGGLYPSGISGLAVLIQRCLEAYANISIPFSAFYIPLNIIPIYIGFKYIGKKFTIFSMYFTILSSILTDLVPQLTITYDITLIAIFGGIINGSVVSLCLLTGGSAGGVDFISIYFSERKGRDVWHHIFVGNIVILMTAGCLFGFDKALYSIIYQFCTTQIITMMYRRYQKHTLLIITEKPDVIYQKIREMTQHDATLFKGIGCYKGVEREMLYSVISSDQVAPVTKAIYEADPAAFINTLKTENITGEFYKPPKE